jgi:hypothetical protein
MGTWKEGHQSLRVLDSLLLSTVNFFPSEPSSSRKAVARLAQQQK